MTFWFVAGGAIAGLLLGVLEPGGGLWGILLGAVAGGLWDRQRRLAARLAAIEARSTSTAGSVAPSRDGLAGAGAGSPIPPPAPAERPYAGAPIPPRHGGMAAPLPATSAPIPPRPGAMPAPPPSTGVAVPPPAAGVEVPPPVTGTAVPPPRPGGPSGPTPPAGSAPGAALPRHDPFGPIRRWFGEGNVPVKVGVVVLFAGVGALLKYAADEGWLRAPIELRLAGISAAAIAALAFGFRQRIARRTFGLAIQGGAIGILAMTVFAAFRLYGLLPASAAFALLVVLTAGAGLLAVLEDAKALAVLGILAGFLAPILVSTGSRNQVALFSWYALLDAAILAIAWFRAWRGLNLLGFAGTYAVGTAWGVLSYDPAKFASTEPFLVLFFLFFLAIPVLHARRRAPAGPGAVDGTLVFGNPLVALALQAALLEGERLPLAYSALAVAGLYLVLALALIRREGYRILGECHAILAIGFATLAVPLALTARTSAGVFALEGAALAWLGLRQARLLPKLAGLALEGLAAIAYTVGLFVGDRATVPVLNGDFAGAALLVTGALASAWLYHRRAAGALRLLAAPLFLLGVFWWTVGGLRELDRFLPADPLPDAWVAFAALTAWLSAELGRRFDAPLPAWIASVALALGPPLALAQVAVHGQPFTPWGLAAWAALAAAGLRALALQRTAARGAARLAHLGWLWTWPVVLGLSLREVASSFALAPSWRHLAMALPLGALEAWLLLRPGGATPLAPRLREARPLVQGTFATALGAGFLVSCFLPGEATPLPYLPLANPLDLLAIGLWVLVCGWLGDRDAPSAVAARRTGVGAGGAFLLLTAATLRGVHHLADLPWDAELVGSAEAQAALAVVWSALGVAGWTIGSRRSSRPVWLAGAVLMGVVLLKLLVVDRRHLGNLAGIVAFLAYGLLCTVVGYLAPAPPRPLPPPEPHP